MNFSRRDFLFRASQYGIAFSLFPAGLGDAFREGQSAFLRQDDLERGILTVPVPSGVLEGKIAPTSVEET